MKAQNRKEDPLDALSHTAFKCYIFDQTDASKCFKMKSGGGGGGSHNI